jgi:hypothetical protein
VVKYLLEKQQALRKTRRILALSGGYSTLYPHREHFPYLMLHIPRNRQEAGPKHPLHHSLSPSVATLSSTSLPFSGLISPISLLSR